jgi:hypothetical protein
MKAIKILAIVLIAFLGIINLALSQETNLVQKIYALDIVVFKNDTAILSGKLIADTGIASDFSPMDDYSIKVLSGDKTELFRGGLIISFYGAIPSSDDLDIPPPTQRSNVTLYNIRVPYYPTAKYITLSHANKTILSIDLSNEVCNNNKRCDLGENEVNCQDCVKLGNNNPEANQEESSGNETQTIPNGSQGGYSLIFPIILGIVIVIVVVICLRRRPSKQSEAPSPVSSEQSPSYENPPQ